METVTTLFNFWKLKVTKGSTTGNLWFTWNGKSFYTRWGKQLKQ